MKYFFCPYCGKQLEVLNIQWANGKEEREFECDDCHKIFMDVEGDYVEEDAE